jgi:hypothetical protein
MEGVRREGAGRDRGRRAAARACRWQRRGMVKQKVRVHRLTLAPSVGTGEKQTEEENDQHGEEERRLLDQEHLVRITEVALTASTNPWCPRVHGVEQSGRAPSSRLRTMMTRAPVMNKIKKEELQHC